MRTVLGDRRFSASGDPLHRASPGADAPCIGRLPHTDPPEHARYRRPMGRAFTSRRITAWEPRIAEVVERHLTAMAEQERPVDLVEALAVPVPLTVIGELMDLPKADWPALRQAASDLLSVELTREEAARTSGWLLDYLRELVARRRSAPGEDLLSELLGHGELTDVEVTDLGATVLMGGFDSLAASISTAVALLLCHPEQPRALAGPAERLDRLVEEVLRHSTIVQHGVDRTALVAVRLGEVDIAAGDRVVAHLPSANRDERLWPRTGEFDTTRPVTPHLAFGHGPHQCVGQQLARLELRLVLARLFHRFPGLRLAVPASELTLRRDRTFAGFQELLVTW